MAKGRKIKGFYYDVECDMYRAQISMGGRRFHLGWFDRAKDAAQAYKEAAAQR